VQKQVEKVNLEAAKDFQKQVSDKIVDLTTDIQVEDQSAVKLDQYLKSTEEKTQKVEEVKKDDFVIDDEDDVIDTSKTKPENDQKVGETYDGSSDEEERKNSMLDLGPKKKCPALKKGDRAELSMVERLMKSCTHLTVTKEVKHPGMFGLLSPSEPRVLILDDSQKLSRMMVFKKV